MNSVLASEFGRYPHVRGFHFLHFSTELTQIRCETSNTIRFKIYFIMFTTGSNLVTKFIGDDCGINRCINVLN